MVSVNIHEAKTHLSKLLNQVEEGEEVVIMRAGVPVARLTSVARDRRKRVAGRYAGKGWISEDFDAPLPASFDGAFS